MTSEPIRQYSSSEAIRGQWVREAEAMAAPWCAVDGCLHRAQQHYPGLTPARAAYCPIHQDRGETP